MASTVCSRCKGPRELDSNSASWCKTCHREYQRNRYHRLRQEAGKPTIDRRHLTEQEQLRERDGQPGLCDACGEEEPEALEAVHRGNEEQRESLRTNSFAAWCKKCTATFTKLTPEEFQRVGQLTGYLSRRWIKVEDVVVVSYENMKVFGKPLV